MSTVKQAGTRVIYNPTLSATLAAQGPLASVPANWTLVANMISVDEVKPREFQVFDDSDLESTAQVVDIEQRAGMGSFTKKKNTQSATLFAAADAGTKYVFAFLYPDGSAHVGLGRLIVSSGAKATKGDFQNKIPESFQVVADTYLVHQASA